jgi:hypothetical protein
MDRNYPSYRMPAELTRRNLDFVIRCSSSSFTAARKMLRGKGPDTRVVKVKPSAGRLAQIRELGLPQTLTVRFVRVRLTTGEWEVPVTSLTDEQSFPTESFQSVVRTPDAVVSAVALFRTVRPKSAPEEGFGPTLIGFS